MAAGHTKDATLGDTGASAPARPLPQVEADRYEVLGEVGEGGIGRVVRANDRRLNRTVAIKLLRRLSAEHEARFFAEAELTARLEHPAIVPVHDVGRWHTGEPFYAMKLVTGDSLKDVVAKCDGLDARLRLLPNVLTVCDAVAYAHSQGVIHRDLKPSNVMVGSFGETVVIDWGLARIVDGVEVRTVAGTPQYMAPEQARGLAVDRRSDVYALGALLYEVLGGRAPFDGESDVLGKVVHEAPAALPDDVPVELAAIVTKAMQKAPADRYADARELGADVRRYLEGQLVAAHRYSLVQRLVRLAARNKPLTAALVLLVIGAAYSFQRIVAERDVARAAEAMAETAQTHAEVRRNHLLLAQSRLWLEKDPTVAFAWLKSFAATGSATPHDVSSIAADALARGVATQLVRGRKKVALSDDSRTLAGVMGNDLVTWTVDDPSPHVLGEALGKVGALRFVGPALYSGEGSTLRRWEAGSAVTVFEAPEPIVAIARAGEAVVVGGELGAVWLERGGRFEKVLQRSARIDRLYVHDGVMLVADSDDAFTVVALDAPKKELVGGAGTGGWFLGGGRVSWGDTTGAVFVYELATAKKQSFTKEHDGVVMTSVLAGPYLASAGQDHLLVVRDLVGGTKRVLEGSDGWLLHAAASPEGELLLTVGQDHVARVWHLASGVSWALRGHTAPFRTFAFTADGARIVTADGEGEVRVWKAPRPRAVALLEAHASQYEEARALPDGRIISAGEDGKLNLWNPVSGERQSVDEPGPAGSVNVVGDRVLNGGGGGAWVRSLADLTAKPVLLDGVGEIHQSALSHDGALAAVACADHSVRVFELESGKGRTVGTHPAAAWHVSFSPDSKWLASTGDDLPVRIWPLSGSGEPRALEGCEGVVFDLQFSPDGRWLAAAGIDPKVRVWSVPDFTLHTLAGHLGTVRQVAWSADGTLLATASDDHSVRVWKPGAGEAPVLVLPHSAQVYTAVFSADGKSLATGDGTGLWRWTVPGGVLLSVDREHGKTLSGLWRSADGSSLVSAAEDHAVRFWPKFFAGGETAIDLAAASSVVLVEDLATSEGKLER